MVKIARLTLQVAFGIPGYDPRIVLQLGKPFQAPVIFTVSFALPLPIADRRI
jgi:hypothetical protein